MNVMCALICIKLHVVLCNMQSNLFFQRSVGSISVSGQLPTYPSPNPTLTLTCYQLTVVELGEG